LGATAASVVLVLVVALLAGLLTHHTGQPGSGTALTPTSKATTAAKPSSTLTTSPPATTGQMTGMPSGWVEAHGVGQGTVPRIAFAPSDPQMAYACTVSASGALVMSGSQDAGAIWHAHGTPLQDEACKLSADPTNPPDLLLSDGSSFSTHLVRSFDGGQTWQPQQVGTLAFQQMGWAGSTAYLTLRTGRGPAGARVTPAANATRPRRRCPRHG
jgi:hypothetical protein